ncbi:MAG: M15 family metallopeptidase [Porcipelethomonas sp.]
MGTYKRKRRRPRYDRIVGALAVLIVLIILLVSCCKSCGGDSDTSGDTSSIVPTEEKKDESQSSDSGMSDDSSLAGLENYSTVSQIPNAVYSGDLVLVNKQHEYSFPASEDSGVVPIYEQMTGSYQVSDYETCLSPVAISALNSLMDKFYEEKGHADCMVICAYRTKEYQDEIFNSGSSDIKGGFSEYHTGLSFDLGIFPEGENSYYYVPDGDYSWIMENCAKYGFVLRYPEGKEDVTEMDSKTYQFRYVGIPHAIYMSENDMCLEEYIDFIKGYTYDTEHLTVAGPDKNYEIYYVPADPSADTQVNIPSDKTYEISGNNVDGFIVTVEL